ncbi:cyclin-J isoform X2 [Nothobranchius furzeri]|uniref:Cyclin-J-like protein n=1 Tax=Nothobranchius furzeri TaxID=105023 RepID=A0A9D2YKH2_NOTFU|nr:cyclin-J-like [Nothobranchius furzeri]
MELEDQWWKGQLAADIYQALRYKELKLPSYKGQSPQLRFRRYFADLIAVISNHFRFCPAARHLAVYLLDLFMDRYDVTVQQLQVASSACLLLASKFEEKEDRVPKLETLNNLGCMSSINLVLTKQGLLHMELLLLKTFDWNLYLPTAAHFIEYYMSVGVQDGDLHDGWPMSSLEKTKLYMVKYADYFLEVSLQDHVFLWFVPSLVAAACVAASRLTLHLSPTWPSRLQRLTGYIWDNLVPCAEKLLMAHDSDVIEANMHKRQQDDQQQHHQTMFHSSGQPITVAQYLHLPSMQPGLVQNQRPPPYLSHSSSSLQGPKAPHHSSNQTISTPLDPKSRPYSVSLHYTCAAQCFDR